jgi:Domain of unknown function (DUF4386)
MPPNIGSTSRNTTHRNTTHKEKRMEPASIFQAPRARITGVVYLLYFLTAILGQSLVSRKLDTLGDAVNLIAYGLYILLTLLFYLLFKPVNRSLSLVAAFFSLLGCIISILDLFHRAPAHITALPFFGIYCLLIGALIYQSTFLPRLLGWLMGFAGLGWLAFLSPPVAIHLALFIESLGILAEASLMLWLLLVGVNVPRWKRLSDAASSIPT